MTSNAKKIQAWRDTHPCETLTEATLLEILDTETLQGADLRGGNLRAADLTGAYLRFANLRLADLRWANLRGAYLRFADLECASLIGTNLYCADLLRANLKSVSLRRANLTEARLTGANLHMANLCDGLTFTGLPSGDGYFIPTPTGWQITIGCWKHKTLDDLRALINDEAEWPEAEGRERERRRPILAGLLDMCEAQAEANPHIVHELAKIHGTSKDEQ